MCVPSAHMPHCKTVFNIEILSSVERLRNNIIYMVILKWPRSRGGNFKTEGQWKPKGINRG